MEVGKDVVAPKEEEAFAIGVDDDEDEEDVDVDAEEGEGEGGIGESEGEINLKGSSDPPPPYEANASQPSDETARLDHSISVENSQAIHYVQRSDTLRGLALKYNVDVRRPISVSQRTQTCLWSSHTCTGPNLMSIE